MNNTFQPQIDKFVNNFLTIDQRKAFQELTLLEIHNDSLHE